ncbi:hypothetical protein GCM10010170_065230 [Dactylosporangium salmoneum]|uniref:HTH luxR-type domain-containing protein n=1 Tax=Dactylosporangium salmoneum TaxID=53361 RepID=A0ABP5U213_9ACTN
MALVERKNELDTLEQALDACLRGHGGVALISAPVGCGKTALWHAVQQRATPAGAVCLSATGSRVESSLALGVVDQLFAGAPFAEDQRVRVGRLLREGTLNAMLYETGAVPLVSAEVFGALTEALVELSERVPLVIGVDDVHLADAASRQFLLYLARRVHRARVLMVLTECVGAQPSDPLFRAELDSQRHLRQILVGALSRAGVAALAGDGVAELHRISGGNPRLLTALLLDRQAAGGTEPVAVADAFAQAVLNCLYRSDATVLRVARMAAVLDEPAPLAVLAELAELDPAATSGALAAAAGMGILREGRFHHPRARAAVLYAMPAPERAALHERAARLLHATGAAAIQVARHAIAASPADGGWSVPVLRDAAEAALEDDDTALALDCCRMADRIGAYGPQRTAVAAALVRTQWRLDPSAADRPLGELVTAARAGHLSVPQGLELIRHLMWHGRPEQAVELLRRFAAAAEPADVPAAIELQLVRQQLCYVYPGRSGQIRAAAGPPLPGLGHAGADWSVRLQAGRVVEALTTGAAISDETLGDAEHVLRTVRLTDDTVGLAAYCVEALIGAERLDAAASWCDGLIREAGARRAPVWRALFRAIRAGVNLRRGNLAEAEEDSRGALTQFSPKGWGVIIGAPLSTLILSTTMAGHHDQAVNHLNVRVPAALFQARTGLLYLRARGRHHLATGNRQAALKDFTTCRDLMRSWGLDLPTLLPWRIDLAETYLALGDQAQARAILRDQLDHLGPHTDRVRGAGLRLLANASEPEHRAGLLHDAASVLEATGDHHQLMLVRADLLTDQQRQPRETPAGHNVLGGHRGASAQRPGRPDHIAELSDAELRVAALAARGHTNPQIARSLFLTVSTVEQHLTRVYRKLNVPGRSALPRELTRRSRGYGGLPRAVSP